MANQAAWLDGKGQTLRVAEAPYPKPDPDQVLVKNHAIAVNPIDWKMQAFGLFIQNWPTVLGTDIAGEVVEVGSNVTKFKKGDRVLSHVISLATGRPQDAAFQLYTTAGSNLTSPIPSSLSYTHATVLPLAINTAAHGLYGPRDKNLLGLDYPSLDPKPSGKTILIWGGSSSVGALAIQLAVASGTKVIAVASQHNHSFVKGLGASEAFDYNSPSVVDDVLAAIKAAGGEFAGIYDAVSNEASFKHVIPIAEKLQPVNVAATLPAPEKLPEGVKPGRVFAVTPEVVNPLWENYVPQALEQGKLKAVPEPLVVGKGLESLQKGLETSKAGVSAKKVVVEL